MPAQSKFITQNCVCVYIYMHCVYMGGYLLMISYLSKSYSLQCILTYRNNPSYISMGILICLSVRSNTDQIRVKLRLFQVHRMCSRNRVLTYSWTS